MSATGLNKLPFGNLPRLLLAWVCTEAVRTQNRALILGPSLAKFMKTLGVYSSGGGNAGIKLRNQMRRLFGCTVTLIYKEGNEEQFRELAHRGRGVSIGGIPTTTQPCRGGTVQSSSVKTCLTRSSTTRCRST